jgi:hypothetical protein
MTEAAIGIDSAEPGCTSEIFRREIEQAINRHSVENGCNTPDYILATYLSECLAAFDRAVNARDAWYGLAPRLRSDLPCCLDLAIASEGQA